MPCDERLITRTVSAQPGQTEGPGHRVNRVFGFHLAGVVQHQDGDADLVRKPMHGDKQFVIFGVASSRFGSAAPRQACPALQAVVLKRFRSIHECHLRRPLSSRRQAFASVRRSGQVVVNGDSSLSMRRCSRRGLSSRAQYRTSPCAGLRSPNPKSASCNGNTDIQCRPRFPNFRTAGNDRQALGDQFRHHKGDGRECLVL